MLHAGYALIAISLFPLLARSVPFGQLGHHGRRQVITETVTSTYVDTSTATTFTTLGSTDAGSSTAAFSSAVTSLVSSAAGSDTQPAPPTSTSTPQSTDAPTLFLPSGRQGNIAPSSTQTLTTVPASSASASAPASSLSHVPLSVHEYLGMRVKSGVYRRDDYGVLLWKITWATQAHTCCGFSRINNPSALRLAAAPRIFVT